MLETGTGEVVGKKLEHENGHLSRMLCL